MSTDFYYSTYEPSAWIQISGEDASSYLQTQFSNDLRNLSPGQAKYGFFLDRKGKIQFDAFLLESNPNSWFLFSYSFTDSHIISLLNKNIISEDVTLTPFSSLVCAVTLWGELPPLDKILFSPKLIPLSGLRSTSDNVDLIFPRELLSEVSIYFHALNAIEQSPEELRQERIRSALPSIPEDLNSDNFPNEGGLASVGVSCNKGCYLGQEVMMRLHTQGSIRKNLYQIQFSTTEDISSNEIFSADKNVGTLKSFFKEDELYTALAMLNKKHLENLTLGLNGTPITILKEVNVERKDHLLIPSY